MGVVVVGVDGSDNSVEALRWAGDHAKRTGAKLRVVHVWEFPYVETAPLALGATLPPYADMESEAREKLQGVIERATLPPDVPVEPVVLEGSASRVLIDEAEGAELLVVGARGRGGFVGLLTGSVATQVVNHARVPVVVIRA